jgi:hypothetical protein
VCPQCGSVTAVHSVEELAAMARSSLGQYGPGYQTPRYQPPPQSPPSSSGFPSAPLSPEFPSSALPPPPPPDYQGPPPPGYTGQARPGRRSSSSGEGSGWDTSFGDDVADAVLGAATKFIGRAIGRRVKRAYEERVVPAMAARQESMLREQIAIAERYPDLRACLNDRVIFLADGGRTLPMPNLASITLQQADAMVAQLRGG